MPYFVDVKTTNQTNAVRDIVMSDEQCFEQLHERTWSVLFQEACRKLGDEDEAYDLLQELFLELWDKRKIFHLQELSLTWLRKRLWYKLITYFRTQGFKQRHLDDFKIFMKQQHVQMHVQEQELLLQELESRHEIIMEAIALAVAQMPEKMQEVFLLNREQHFSINEIARRLELSPHTVRNHLQASMKRLRLSLKTQNLSPLGLSLLLWIISDLY